jgi:hypothetical protein
VVFHGVNGLTVKVTKAFLLHGSMRVYTNTNNYTHICEYLMTILDACYVKEKLSLAQLKPWRHMPLYDITLYSKWKWTVDFLPKMLCCCENNPRYPLDKRLSGHTGQLWTYRVDKDLCPCCDLKADFAAVKPVAYSRPSMVVNNIYISHSVN